MATQAKKERGQGRAVEPGSKATFTSEAKQAQYARLAAFNYAVKDAKALGITVDKSWDVNSVPNSVLEKAGHALAHSNLLHGAEGLELLSKLTEKGSTTGRPLTKAYAQEVRPFIRRLEFSAYFGRKPRVVKEKVEGEKKAPVKKAAPKAASKTK